MSFQRDFLSKRITDPLAKKIHDLSQEEYAQNFQVQNIDNLNVQILSIKAKTKTLSKDKFHISVKSYDSSQIFYNAVYPDRNKLKLWLKGENSDKLHDYSLLQNNAHLWSPFQVAEQYLIDEPEHMAGHEIVSYVNGSHYIHVQDDPKLRISDLVVSENTVPGFTIITRFNPLSRGASNQDSKILEQKIDSSQNRYGHSINIDHEGDIYFYVRYNYRQYFVKLDSPIVIPSFTANYLAANYKSKNYKTESTTLLAQIDVSYDLVCEFVYATKECIIKLLFEGEIIASASSLSGIDSLPPDLQINLPLQEGKWSETKTLPNNLPMNQVYDSSSNQYIGTINNSGVTATWEDNNTFHDTGQATTGATYISVPHHANIANLTEFTMDFWIKMDSTGNDGTFRYLVNKGWQVNGSFIFYRVPNSGNYVFAIRNDSGVNGAVTLTNPFTDTTKWYHVCLKWKSGEKLKAYVNNGTVIESSTTLSGSMINTATFNLFGTMASDASIINFMFFSRQITTAEQITLHNYGSHLAQFPTNLEPQRLTNPTPPPQTNPVTTIYDLQKINSPVIGDYTFINNPSSQNPFVAKYTCPDGIASAVPEATIYNIAAGSGGTTTNPFSPVYTLPGVSSTGQIQHSTTASNNEWAYVQQIQTNQSSFFGKKITEITVDLNGLGNPEGGNVYLGIVKNDGNVILFGAAIAPASIPSAWTSYTRQLTTNTYAMAIGDGVGVIWQGGTDGDVNVRRGGSAHADPATGDTRYSCQNGRRGTGLGEWKTPNEDWSMAGTFKTGGDVTGTSPYATLRSASGFLYQAGEIFQANSPMLTEIPTTVSFRVYRDSAATSGQVSIRHVKADGTFYPTLYEINVSALPTTEPTDFNFTWNNYSYNNPILVNERLAVVVNGSTVGNVYVLTNTGNSGAANNYDTTKSCYNTRAFTGGTFASNTALDMSGVIKKGGSSFVPKKAFSPTITRIYERAVNVNSSFYDQPISRVTVRGKRVGTGSIPAPSIISCVLRNSANAEKVTIGTLDANSIGATLQDITFTNNNNAIKVAATDYMSIEIGTCTLTDYIELNINTNVVDSGNSILGAYENSIITDMGGYDLAGHFDTGGQIDNTSRMRVAQYIDTQDSLFLQVPNNKITEFNATLMAKGTPTGTVFINLRRGIDDALIFQLGTVPAGSITTALTGTPIHITNYTNTYILAAKDKISIEYEGGDQLNQIGVMIKQNSPDYDGLNSYIARYNGVVYDYITAKDMVATIKVGGDTYQPEANAPPPVLPQNSTDLYILTGSAKKDVSFTRAIFGMYLFFHTLLTDTELINFNTTRIDVGNNPPDSIQCTNYSFFRNS